MGEGAPSIGTTRRRESPDRRKSGPSEPEASGPAVGSQLVRRVGTEDDSNDVAVPAASYFINKSGVPRAGREVHNGSGAAIDNPERYATNPASHDRLGIMPGDGDPSLRMLTDHLDARLPVCRIDEKAGRNETGPVRRGFGRWRLIEFRFRRTSLQAGTSDQKVPRHKQARPIHFGRLFVSSAATNQRVAIA